MATEFGRIKKLRTRFVGQNGMCFTSSELCRFEEKLSSEVCNALENGYGKTKRYVNE